MRLSNAMSQTCGCKVCTVWAIPRHDPTTATTLRLTAGDRRALEALEQELACSKADIVRLGLAALRRNPELRCQLLAERTASAFLARLKDTHGPHSQLQVPLRQTDGATPARWLVSRRGQSPVDPTDLEVRVRYDDETYFVDLIDPHTSVGIHNAWWITTGEEETDIVLPVSAVNFWQTAPLSEPAMVALPDGRRAVEVEQDDGTVKHYALGQDGKTTLLHEDQRATWYTPSETGR